MATPLQKFKYFTYISKIKSCPHPSVAPQSLTAFRFVFADIHNHRNFKPVAILDPKRKRNGQLMADCCIGYGLSMYITLNQLENHARSASKASPQILKRIGNHVAAVALTSNDGECSEANGTGHFTFFEYGTFAAEGRVTVIKRLEL